MRRQAGEEMERDARDAAMGDDDASGGKPGEQGAGARGERGIAFSVWGRNIPHIRVADGVFARGIAPDLLPGEAFPAAKAELFQLVVDPVGNDGREAAFAHKLAHQDLKRFPRPQEGTCDEIRSRGVRHKLGQHPTGLARLLAPAPIELGVALSLEPSRGIPGRLAVADEKKHRAGLEGSIAFVNSANVAQPVSVRRAIS